MRPSCRPQASTAGACRPPSPLDPAVVGLLVGEHPLVGRPALEGRRAVGVMHMGRVLEDEHVEASPPSPFGAWSGMPDHAPNGLGGLASNMLVFQDPTHMHHPDGWPTLPRLAHVRVGLHPRADLLPLDRAGLAGRPAPADDARGRQLGGMPDQHPQADRSCNEMDAVRREIQATKDLQAYIDAQAGGPGRGSSGSSGTRSRRAR